MINKLYEIAVNQKYKYDEYHSGLASMICKFFDKKTGLEASVNEEIAPESNKPIIKKFKRSKVYVWFKDNIWAADLAEMGSLFCFNRCVNVYASQIVSPNVLGLNL